MSSTPKPKRPPPVSISVPVEDVAEAKKEVDRVLNVVHQLEQDAVVKLEDLQIQNEIARGQGGIVKRVVHKVTGQVYALKLIQLQVSDDTRNRIVQELEFLKRCFACPSIVGFSGAFFREGELCVCMELMDAGSLLDVYQKAGMVPEYVLGAITVNVLDALVFLKQELHIMHRDIKPANILMNTHGDVKVCDLGVSGQLENSVAKSSVGTMMYFAPERIDSTGRETYTVQADVWSFGVTLAEVALGFYPYPKRSVEEGRSKTKKVKAMGVFDILTNIVNGEPSAIPQPEFSAEFCDFIACCLIKEPLRRPAPLALQGHAFYLNNLNYNKGAIGEWVRGVLASAAAAKAAAAGAGGGAGTGEVASASGSGSGSGSGSAVGSPVVAPASGSPLPSVSSPSLGGGGGTAATTSAPGSGTTSSSSGSGSVSGNADSFSSNGSGLAVSSGGSGVSSSPINSTPVTSNLSISSGVSSSGSGSSSSSSSSSSSGGGGGGSYPVPPTVSLLGGGSASSSPLTTPTALGIPPALAVSSPLSSPTVAANTAYPTVSLLSSSSSPASQPPK